jgi:hypothetical protein
MADQTEKQVADGTQDVISTPIAPEHEHAIDEKHQIKDEAGAIAQIALASGLASPEESKAVLRKIDLYILPMMCMTYGEQ